MAGAVAAGPLASDVEQASYRVLFNEQSIEWREYTPVIVAETTVSGPREESIREGFSRLADYIFGKNRAQEKIAMTAPVMQQQSETITMTAPVLQEKNATGWHVQFIMPSHYTLDTLPKPLSKDVQLHPLGKRYVAAISFSGTATDALLEENTEALYDHVRKHHLTPTGEPMYAFYNPPWTLPFLRRNEVLIPIQPPKQ